MGLTNGKEVAQPTNQDYILPVIFRGNPALSPHMKPPVLFCGLMLCLTSLSCERHAVLRKEVSTLSATIKKDQAAIQQYDKDIAALGGKEALPRLVQQGLDKETELRPLEFVNGPRERKLSAIESEFAVLKPAAEAFKAANSK